LNTITNALKTFILRSNERIYQLGQENSAYQGMGTTVSSMLFYQNSLVCAHVGDSRIYRYRHNTLTLLTYDHTLKNKLLQQGRLDEAIAKGIRYKNVLTKAIGAFKTVTPDILISPVEPGDLYIMCSDGLSDYLSDEEMLSTLTLPLSLQELTFQLIQQAKAKGGCDNITVLVTKVSST
ncbi:MAG: serine/threonine-protein phosphatase, partial [Chlamydiae bacterium]|nr:serine/threonine-protein phosphatase [Chlamydiota bacterium]